MAKTPLLTLNTLLDRDVVMIDGQPYELRIPGEFTMVEYHRIERRGKRLEELSKRGDDLSEDETAEVAKALDELCHLVLVAPDDVFGRLTEMHRQAIIGAFMQPLREKTAPAAGKPAVEAAPSAAQKNLSIGGSTSPDSSASTEGPRSTGSRESRRLSSRPTS